MNKKDLKIAYILNIVIFALITFSTLWMMSGIRLTSGEAALMSARLAMFKYFTVDSNVLMGTFALIAAIEMKQVMNGKKKKISKLTNILLLTGTVGVTLTMLVTLFFLAPTMGLGVVYMESNLFLHVINPTISIIAFIFFEKSKDIDFKHTFTATIPLVLYAIYYVEEVLRHTTNGIIAPGYDWYGFFFLGVKSVVIVLPIIFLVTYGISAALWKLNKPKAK